jgi:hypothetical protein
MGMFFDRVSHLVSEPVSHAWSLFFLLGHFLRYGCTSQYFHFSRATQQRAYTDSIGNADLLEFFILSIRRTTNHPEYAHKNKRLTLCRRAKLITLRRDEILLLRLIIDSRILIDLLTDPQSTLAVKLKAKCADLHREHFPWLLDPVCINIDLALDVRRPSILDESTTNGHWIQVEWLMQQALRPCAEVMDPSLSAAHEVVKAYLLPHTDPLQQPNFYVRIPLAHMDTLPYRITCNTYRWYNFDHVIEMYRVRGDVVETYLSYEPFRNQ